MGGRVRNRRAGFERKDEEKRKVRICIYIFCQIQKTYIKNLLCLKKLRRVVVYLQIVIDRGVAEEP